MPVTYASRRFIHGSACPRPGHEDRPLRAPGDQGVVDELPSVVAVQANHRVGQPISDLSDGRDGPGVCPVSDRDVLGPAEVDVGDGQSPSLLTLEAVPAVSDQIDLKEPWSLLHLVHALAHHQRGTQRAPGRVADFAAG